MPAKNILWFSQIGYEDIAHVGGKGANLGEMYNLGIPVPNGFVVTSDAYFYFVKHNGLNQKIKDILTTIDVDQPDQLQSAAAKIKKIISRCQIPDDLALDVMKAYQKLSDYGGLKNAHVAVRSSATAEDLPDASFAGQQETYLNVVGESNVINRLRDCYASLFTPRAIFYRVKKHFDHFNVGIAVPVQKMVESTVSGIMFTVNPVSNDKDHMVVEAIWGLGEYIVQGIITPDQYLVKKNDWTIDGSVVRPQDKMLTFAASETKEVNVAASKQKNRKLSDNQIIKLAKIGQKLQNHYRKPQDIEFAVEGDKIFVVQTRPITTIISNQKTLDNQNTLVKPADLQGEPASPGTASGQVVIISDPKHLNKAQKGQILVTPMTTPDFVPAMKKVAGIITDRGGQTSHAAIVSRELGIPCVVGTKIATKKFKDGDWVTLNGTDGKVWAGNLLKDKLSQVKQLSATTKVKTATKLYVNLGEPDLAADIAQKNVDGVGLLRAEFMMANIGIHPKRIISEHKETWFINQLATDLKKFCQSFNPRPVIYRATDFKTNEYRYLKWGKYYEPEEPNPMLGFRGAVRYIRTPDVFNMELEAIKKVRNTYNLKNLWLMIPFVRTPQQLIEVKKIIAAAGLLRSPSFKLFMMAEIPSNVILLDKFIDVGIDGISIGSNDLTMLTLGIDRDNQEVAPDFSEMDPSVLWSLRRLVKKARKRGISASICGQAPSNYPELVEKLVKWGVTSISVSPDAIERTRDIIRWAEKRKVTKK